MRRGGKHAHSWRSSPRPSVWDTSRLVAFPPITAAFATWGSFEYFAAAIGGGVDPAGNHNRWMSALVGLLSLVVAVVTTSYILLWLRRPARPREPGLLDRPFPTPEDEEEARRLAR